LREKLKSKTANIIFLIVCIMLAILLLTKLIDSTLSGIIFAIALVLFGILSRGFKRNENQD